MAITFLTAVSDVLSRVGEVSQDVAGISTFGDTSLSVKIDLCRQCWNDVVHHVLNLADMSFPTQADTATITLVDGQRSYALPADFSQIRWPLTNASDGWLIYEFPGGYLSMRVARAQPQLYVGIPEYGVIDPTNRELLVDTIPDSSADGTEFELLYNKVNSLTAEVATFPFSDEVVHALYGAVAELYKYERQRIFAQAKYNYHVANALRILRASAQEGKW